LQNKKNMIRIIMGHISRDPCRYLRNPKCYLFNPNIYFHFPYMWSIIKVKTKQTQRFIDKTLTFISPHQI